jgi:hypothetical protein
VRHIVREVRKGPDELPGYQGSDPAVPGAADGPVPADAPAGIDGPLAPAEA